MPDFYLPEEKVIKVCDNTRYDFICFGLWLLYHSSLY